MNDDLGRLEDLYTELGVRVIRCKSETTDSVFHRDVQAWSPFGSIAGEHMGKESRRWEKPRYLEQFADHFIGGRPRFTAPEGSFEGADVMWINSRHCVMARGTRSNATAVGHIATWLRFMDIVVTVVDIPDWHDQHLLGIMNVVRGWKIFVDDRAVPESPETGWLAGAVLVPHDEYNQKATNFVQTDEGIVVPAGAHRTIELLEESGVPVYSIEIPQLLAHGGGVACATGIIQDQLPAAGEDWFDEYGD